jgi:hypothetical protein
LEIQPAQRPRLLLGAFLALPIRRNLAVHPGTAYTKYLFVKKQEDGSLFVANVSALDTPECVSKLFARWGPVRGVDIAGPATNPFARVRFEDAGSARRVMASTSRELGRTGELAEEELGLDPVVPEALARWREELRRPSRAELGAKADQVVGAFDELEARQAEELQRAESQVDNDGFVKVVNKRRPHAAAAAPAGGGGAASSKARKPEILEGFYRFEKVDARKEELARLKSKFEQTRENLKRTRESRVFKPL